MRRRTLWIMLVLLVALLAAGGLYLALRPGRAAHAPRTPALPTGQPSVSPVVSTPPADAAADPYALLSQEAMLETIDALTSIQPYSGWRNSATTGEAEALEYIDQALDDLGYLVGLGLEQERQSFEVPLGTEQWDTGLELTLDGKPIQVPASGLRGSRSDPALARNFDSDGVLGDSERNPVVVEGPVVRIRSADEVDDIAYGALEGRVVLLDYAVIDPIARRGMEPAASTAATLLAHEPAGLVLVTQFSNDPVRATASLLRMGAHSTGRRTAHSRRRSLSGWRSGRSRHRKLGGAGARRERDTPLGRGRTGTCPLWKLGSTHSRSRSIPGSDPGGAHR